MKNLIITIFLAPSLLILPMYAGAQPLSVNEILTAIDVINLMNDGANNADIAKALSLQWGFDREAALGKGVTDEMIIKYLIGNRKSGKNIADDNKSRQHKSAGDQYAKESQYNKAAKEFTLAIMYSEGRYAPYLWRADVYKKLLNSRVEPATGIDSGAARRPLSNQSRIFLCDAAYSDIATARKINSKNLTKIVSEIQTLATRLNEQDRTYPADSKVAPSRYVGGRNIHDMRKLDKLYQSQIIARQASVEIGMTLSDYKSVCEMKEDAARLEEKKIEKDIRRDKKWVKYGERDETSYFYDQLGIEKSKDTMKAWIRQENIHDDKAYDTAHLDINCRTKTIITTEVQSHDEMGDSVSDLYNFSKIVAPNTPEAMLFKELCK